MIGAESDIGLLERWRAGDKDAGNILVRRHFDRLHRFFSSKAFGYEEDLVQQTFMACVEARDAFRGESTFLAYLFGLARFQLLTHYRKRNRDREVDPATSSICDLCTSPTGALAKNDERRLIETAMRQIPVDQQIALELVYWEELSAPEVARVLDIAENTVYSRLHRAKTRLREELEKITHRAPHDAFGMTLSLHRTQRSTRVS